MKITVLVLLLSFPGLALGQSLGELAKKEKERREKNKKEGKTAIVVTEDELYPDGVPETGDAEGNDGDERSTTSRSSARNDEDNVEEIPFSDEEESIEVPTRIPPGLPMEERLAMFQVMKRDYERQVREIDQLIAENEQKLRQLDARIGATSAAGGAGLPTAPQSGTGVANQPMTGQESVQLVEEKNRLERANESLRGRKESLKLNLQEQGRVGGIPPGYLRF